MCKLDQLSIYIILSISYLDLTSRYFAEFSFMVKIYLQKNLYAPQKFGATYSSKIMLSYAYVSYSRGWENTQTTSLNHYT